MKLWKYVTFGITSVAATIGLSAHLSKKFDENEPHRHVHRIDISSQDVAHLQTRIDLAVEKFNKGCSQNTSQAKKHLENAFRHFKDLQLYLKTNRIADAKLAQKMIETHLSQFEKL